jgi:hypothetical protein
MPHEDPAMMLRRFLLVLAAGVALEAAVFAAYYDDLIYLRQPLGAIAAGERGAFLHHATDALRRPKLTMQHLETLAAGAQLLRLHHIEVQALERLVHANPSDRSTRLRLGDALRRAGELTRAEAVYVGLLTDLSGEAP